MPEPIVFVDMAERNAEVRKGLKDRRFVLRRRKAEQDGFLEPLLQAELDEISQKLYRKLDKDTEENEPDSITVLDPLYLALQKEFESTNQPVGPHVDGKLPSQQGAGRKAGHATKDVAYTPGTLTAAEQAFSAVYGILERENMTNPELGRRFSNALALARGEFNGQRELFANTFSYISAEGDLRGERPAGQFVVAKQWAAVVRTLANQGVAANHIHLGQQTLQALLRNEGADDSAPPSALEIDLPDLEEQTDVEIIVDNLHAMQAIYFSAMLEELKLFQVVEKLVELFQYGMLPLGKGTAGDILYGYMKKGVTRLTEYDRRNLYARTLGFAGGETMGNPNREFQSLWLRFISAVSTFARQLTLDNLLRSNIPARVHQEQVRKSGRDLAANLSLYGYGMAYHAATELQNQMKEIISLLSDPEIKNAYGARDMWQVVDQVAALELGGQRDSVRYRTMANSGAIIIRWLANRGNDLSSAGLGEVLNMNEIVRPRIRPKGDKVTLNPYDSDLVNACERWLAVTGTPDTQVETYSDPYEAPPTTSRPIQIPAAARELLESVGVSAGVNGYPRR